MAVVGVYAARAYLNSDPSLVLRGPEAQFLTSSAYLASESLQSTGVIARWNPWFERGQPVIDYPFSFVLNPLSTLPSLIIGPINGIKASIVLYTVFAGIGGWLLGRMLGLGALARVLLALICLARGSMQATVSNGYFQLGLTQAYLPWIAAATLAIIRYKQRRYPVVLLAIMLTFVFWGGNIYYTLPGAISVGVLALAFVIVSKKDADGWRWHLDTALIRRLALAAVLTIGLAAATLIPIFAHQGQIVGHTDENVNAIYENPAVVAVEFFTPEIFYAMNTWNETYFNFVIPWWFVALIFVVIPPLGRRLHQPADFRFQRRVTLAALFMLVFFFTWGTGTNPIVRWAYLNLPLIAQWRVLSRMLTVSAMWVAVIVALRVDGLWRVAVQSKRWDALAARLLRFPQLTAQFHRIVGVLLVIAAAAAVVPLVDAWQMFGAIEPQDHTTVACINWLRASHPNDQLAVWGRDYNGVTVFVQNHVRFTHFSTDFHSEGLPSTLFDGNLSDTFPEYVISYNLDERSDFLAKGYAVDEDSPLTDALFPCLLYRPGALSYAFSIPLSTLELLHETIDPNLTQPITAVSRQFDHVGLIVNGNPEQDTVVVAQELDWPGWRVTVDGLPAQLESVGQLVGVVLPASTIPHRILFVYDPPLLKIGGVLTLATILFSVLYMLYAERLIGRRRKPRSQHEPTYPGYPPLSI